ncbi:MAG: endopeptidase La [bacterium]|nr:endopeptidase La [bacterium]
MQTKKPPFNIPDQVPVLILDDVVIFPNIVMPLTFTEEPDLKLINDTAVGSKIVGVFSKKIGKDGETVSDDIFPIGTAATILKLFRMPDESLRIIVQGLQRIKLEEMMQSVPYLKARIEVQENEYNQNIKTEALYKNIIETFKKIVQINQAVPEEIVTAVMNIKEPAVLADFIASNLDIRQSDRQEILKEINIEQRLNNLSSIMGRELRLMEIGSKIEDQISDQFAKSQRKFFLRQQLKEIKKELGEGHDLPVEIMEYEDKIKKAKMPKDAKEAAEKELDRLKNMNPASAEYTVSINYLDWMVSLPWVVSTKDTMDIKKAQKILNRDHYGLDDIKERIIEYLAIKKLNKTIKGPILCFVGPPGVGKTSLGQSIARSLGRKFIRQSLGGMRDEAEIRGHRKTYVGAMPGRVIQSIKNVKSNNPVFMLDEVDKIGMDFRGDPASALLEVLDPAQNSTFSDHYIEVPFDLSNVMFITTANQLHPIPAPLRDRMEIIQLPGYINEEKVKIAQKYLIPRQIKENGLKVKDISFTISAIRKVIGDYTREAGVRNLERELGSICRKIARKFAEGNTKAVKVTREKVEKYLGPVKHVSEVINREDEVGVATGLAWTPVGGEVLFIESVIMPGTKGFILTGHLGDVMKESAKAAMSYIRSKAGELNIDERSINKSDIHIHVPAGATPKDGPSAGITIATSLASLLSKKPIKHDMAMTGEITLRGKVMPVGGIKEKVIAAKRAGIKSIVIPKQNVKDLKTIPDNIIKSLDILPVDKIDDVWDLAFVDGKKIRRARQK